MSNKSRTGRSAAMMMSCVLFSSMLSACSGGTVRGSERAEATPSGETEPLQQAAGGTAESPTGTASSGTAAGKKTIVFATFYETDFLKEAIQKYEAKHPDIQIQMTYAHPAGNDAQWEADQEKFIKTMNTQMLTGKGPDLLELDQLPMDKYAGKKLLLNLSEKMEQDSSFHREQYFTNILDNTKLGGSVYGIPLRFYLYAMIGNEEGLEKSGVPFDDKSWTWQQFIQTAKALAKQGSHPYAFYGDEILLLTDMVNESYDRYVDAVNRKASFDSPAFVGLLKQIKAMIDGKLVNNHGRSDTFFRMDTVSSIRSYTLAGTNLTESYSKVKLYNKPKAEGQKPGGFFKTDTTLGINAKSAVHNETWEFLKFLLSDETEPGGFSVNKQAYKKQAEQMLQVGTVKADEEGPLKGKEFKVTPTQVQELEAYLTDAIHPVEYRPSKVEQILTEEAAAFFKGQKSAEAVAKLVQNRVSTYLNE
ncbi:extracellular solute-binding protein [Paenibacillus filicis]|uniref:Extracellular solute-binding protein n=1 Tax=Paenibacillus filicis TaxID=669464 RepID=A0ABU9DCK3_9BACL